MYIVFSRPFMQTIRKEFGLSPVKNPLHLQTSPTPGPLLPSDELVWPTEKNLRGQVPAQFAAERAHHHNGLEWELLPARRHIAAAPLAGDYECLAA
jgi:hypothetical protein